MLDQMLSTSGGSVLFVLIVVSSEAASTTDLFEGLATAAADRGHEVAVFFNAHGVRLVIAPGTGGLDSLIGLGVRLMACRTSVMECGFKTEKALAAGAEMSSLSELVELMERSDRAIFLG
jgi:predicted peroxiredoxin